jgi:hypothetical protein
MQQQSANSNRIVIVQALIRVKERYTQSFHSIPFILMTHTLRGGTFWTILFKSSGTNHTQSTTKSLERVALLLLLLLWLWLT